MNDVTGIIQDIDLDDLPEDEVSNNLSRPKRKNSKKKGNRFELQIANDLTKQFQDILGATFRRVPQSGAMFGGRNWNKKNQQVDEAIIADHAGDILTPRNFPFCIECKNYDDTPKFHKIFAEGDKKFTEWIKQAENDSEKAKKDWLLIFKVTKQRNTFVCLDIDVFDKMKIDNTKSFMKYKNNIIVTYKYFLKNALIPYINKLNKG